MNQNHITCSELSEIDPAHPCVVAIDNMTDRVAFVGEWGTDKVQVHLLADGATGEMTLTWQEVKELEQALNLLAHVVTRTGEY